MYMLTRVALVATAALSVAAHAEPLALEDAIARALAAAPQAEANKARLEALRAARGQAGVKPNPSIEVVGENFAGTGPYLVDRAEITASYAQIIERGGKREARVALAERDIEIAKAEANAQRLDIIAVAQRGYVEVQAAEAALGIAKDKLVVARGLAREVDRRVKSAKDPLFAGTRANTLVAEARVDVELAKHARDAALTRLAALWNGNPAGLEVPAGDFLSFNRPERSTPEPAAADFAVLQARTRRAEAAIALERARRVQDPTVRGGLRYLHQSNDVALVGGVSIPLARHDTNRLNVERATAERAQAAANLEVARVMRLRELRLAEEKVAEARHEAEAIRGEVIPGLEKTLAQVFDGYSRGGFSYNDVVQAQAALGNARARLKNAAAAYHNAGVELDRLTGRFANSLLQEEAR
ncbi:TolC family protein [Allosphingosinicella humi]